MMQTKTRSYECSGSPRQLLMAFELGEQCWKVGFTTGQGGRVRTRRIAAGALGVLVAEIAKAKAVFGLAPDAPVISCYEAGRDGFWLRRYLVAHGVTNYVVDSASIEVNRRARRTKTDAVDLRGLLTLLARYVAGERHCWRVVRVPSLADEDARQLHRTWETLQADRTRVVNRLKGLLATHGVRLTMTADFLEQVAATRLWDGSELPPGARDRLARDWAQLQALEQQLREVHAARAALRIDPATPTGRAVRALEEARQAALIRPVDIFRRRDTMSRPMSDTPKRRLQRPSRTSSNQTRPPQEASAARCLENRDTSARRERPR